MRAVADLDALQEHGHLAAARGALVVSADAQPVGDGPFITVEVPDVDAGAETGRLLLCGAAGRKDG
ncbi:hypothetical protein [Streptomyces sp. NPDC051561]|uniref:hypothetical protein n=1 Tax=Streptomyces sp. NPDC051561 TaxID=3365658 RepID=UPI0037B80F2F